MRPFRFLILTVYNPRDGESQPHRLVARCCALRRRTNLSHRLDDEGQSLSQANEIQLNVTQLIGGVVCPLLVQS